MTSTETCRPKQSHRRFSSMTLFLPDTISSASESCHAISASGQVAKTCKPGSSTISRYACVLFRTTVKRTGFARSSLELAPTPLQKLRAYDQRRGRRNPEYWFVWRSSRQQFKHSHRAFFTRMIQKIRATSGPDWATTTAASSRLASVLKRYSVFSSAR